MCRVEIGAPTILDSSCVAIIHAERLFSRSVYESGKRFEKNKISSALLSWIRVTLVFYFLGHETKREFLFFILQSVSWDNTADTVNMNSSTLMLSTIIFFVMQFRTAEVCYVGLFLKGLIPTNSQFLVSLYRFIVFVKTL